MALLNRGTPVTYGTNDITSNNSTGVVTLRIVDDSSGSDVVKFSGEMYASEVRLGLEADNNQALSSNGEVVSHCTYNQRKVLNLTGIILANAAASSTPSGTDEDIAKANSMFAAQFTAGMRLDVSYHNWDEVNAADADAGLISQHNLAHTTGGLGNFTITSAEKTRSNNAFAEWTISAIEYLNVVHGGSDTAAN
tara:strand:+ start:4398 stop:4979 length:582 start_codon:yes stop_codon:yes gene_type:complete